MGKYLGKIVSILMIWFVFHDGTLVMKNLSDFTSVIVLNKTPVILTMIFFIMLLIWAQNEGIEVLGSEDIEYNFINKKS